MLFITSLILMFTYMTPTSNGVTMAGMAQAASQAAPYIKQLWDQIFDEEKMPNKPRLLLRLRDTSTGKFKQKLVKWDKNKIDPSEGPYAYLLSKADRLARNKDISRCDMQYYDEEEALSIDDDESILELLEAGPDIGGNKRRIDIICDADPHDMESPRTRKDFVRATNAYNYAIMATAETSKSDKDAAEQGLKKIYLGGYNLESDGIQILDHDSDTFLAKALHIANKWEWDEKTKSVIEALPDGDKVFQSRSYVKFDAPNWRIVGSFAKLAGWKSDPQNNKTSLFVATSKFEFTIPRAEREGNIADKYLGGAGGTISQEFMDNIETVLKYRAMIKSREQLNKPDAAELEIRI